MRWRFLLLFIYSEQIVLVQLARVIDNWADSKHSKTIYDKTSVI